MRLPFFLNLLLAFVLLSATACSNKKQDDPTPTPTGSYRLNGNLVNCQVRADYSSAAGYDYLDIYLDTTPQPAGGTETMRLAFYKASSRPNTDYEIGDIIIYDSAHPQGTPFLDDAAAIAPTTNGGFSGTFSGQRSIATGTIYQQNFVLTAGVFADVRP